MQHGTDVYWVCVFGCSLDCVYWYGLSQDNLVVDIVLFSCILCVRVSIVSFRAVALPVITDQMIGASGDQLATAIDWYVWSIYLIPADSLGSTFDSFC